MPPLSVLPSTGLTITNPLVLYRALLVTKQIDPDPAQHRLALHLQRLYFRLKDYSPKPEYGTLLNSLYRPVHNTALGEDDRPAVADPGHPLRNNPLFAHLFSRKERRDTLALTRVLTNHQAAIDLDSPRGLLLHGEVGTGKSMLVDLLADSLPNRKKKRWHFNTFMLETLARLEGLRRSRQSTASEFESEHSLLWLAKDMIEKSPILFLDEFQLPDRAASKILSNLLTSFFQLGGVLIASSNRMPDELAKASGVEYSPPSRAGLVSSWLGAGTTTGRKVDMFASGGEFSGFLEVLKARCEVWNIEGTKDWRRREVEQLETQNVDEHLRQEMIGQFTDHEKVILATSELDDEMVQCRMGFPASDAVFGADTATTPKQYLLSTITAKERWEDVVKAALPVDTPFPVPWKPMTLSIYGRKVSVPRQYSGITYWTFTELCEGAFGPADYITLASNFHTIILDMVPILTLLQKNEARRLITLLDALYEARCKLIVRAEAGPDELFFPETMKHNSISSETRSPQHENDGGDAVYPETLSEIYQDQTSPFRPNVASYTEEPKTGYGSDEDSDFGSMPGTGNEIGRQVDFGMTSSFTGEDERFAFKRASSRLWEMCGSRWHARTDRDWWRPLPLEIRRWERSACSESAASVSESLIKGDVRLGPVTILDKPAGLQRAESKTRDSERVEHTASPFGRTEKSPSKIGWTHAWGMMTWGKKSGAWGKGPEGLSQRKKDGEMNSRSDNTEER